MLTWTKLDCINNSSSYSHQRWQTLKTNLSQSVYLCRLRRIVFFSHEKPKKLITVSLLLVHSRCCTVLFMYVFFFPSLIEDLHLKKKIIHRSSPSSGERTLVSSGRGDAHCGGAANGIPLFQQYRQQIFGEVRQERSQQHLYVKRGKKPTTKLAH